MHADCNGAIISSIVDGFGVDVGVEVVSDCTLVWERGASTTGVLAVVLLVAYC